MKTLIVTAICIAVFSATNAWAGSHKPVQDRSRELATAHFPAGANGICNAHPKNAVYVIVAYKDGDIEGHVCHSNVTGYARPSNINHVEKSFIYLHLIIQIFLEKFRSESTGTYYFISVQQAFSLKICFQWGNFLSQIWEK